MVRALGTTRASKGLSHGALAAVRGFRMALAHREVRRLYRWVVLGLFLTTLAVMGGLGALLFHYTASLAEAGAWGTAALWLARIAGLGVAGLAAPLLALFVVNALLPILGERLFVAALGVLAPRRAAALAAAEGTSFAAGLVGSGLRLGYFLALTAAAFAVTLIPVAGAVLGPLMQGYVTARALTWELLDPYFDRRGLGFQAQRAVIRGERWAVVGFGLPLGLVLALPLVGPLLFGFAQAAAACFVVEVLEDGDEDGDGATTGGC